MWYVIIACALVSVAALAVALASRTSAIQAYAGVRRRMKQLDEQLKQQSSTQLRVELDALAGDVDKLSRSTRKQFGSVWARIGEEEAPQRDDRTVDMFPTQLVACQCGWCQACQERRGAVQ